MEFERLSIKDVGLKWMPTNTCPKMYFRRGFEKKNFGHDFVPLKAHLSEESKQLNHVLIN